MEEQRGDRCHSALCIILPDALGLRVLCLILVGVLAKNREKDREEAMGYGALGANSPT